VQAESSPIPARTINEDLTGLFTVDDDDGALTVPGKKSKPKKKSTKKNKEGLDLTDLFAPSTADNGLGGSGSGRGGRGDQGGSRAGPAVYVDSDESDDFPALRRP
jgi:hypothetical protein